jgi:hypothetical protein
MDDQLPVDVAAASDGGLAACTRAANYDDDGGYAQCQSVSHEYGLHSLTPTERLACQELLPGTLVAQPMSLNLRSGMAWRLRPKDRFGLCRAAEAACPFSVSWQ